MIEIERVITSDPERVWELVSDLDNWGQMLPTMQSVTRLGGPGATTVGTRFEVRQPGLPKAVYEITDWRPGHGFTWVASSPGVRTTATHEVASGEAGTRLALGIVWGGPLAGIVRALLGSKARGMVQQEADTFARLAEEQ